MTAHDTSAGETERRRLLARLAASREAFLAAVDRVPARERETRPVCGEWTTLDLVGHVADWEAFCVDSLRRLVAGQATHVVHDGNIEAWNQAKAAARRGQPWDAACQDLHAVRQDLLEIVEGLSDAVLAQAFPTPWDLRSTVGDWIEVFAIHEHEHAQDIRDSVPV